MRISSGSSIATTSRSRVPAGSLSASTSRVEYAGAWIGSPDTRVSVLVGRARTALPSSRERQLATAQMANTVSDQFAPVAVTSRAKA